MRQPKEHYQSESKVKDTGFALWINNIQVDPIEKEYFSSNFKIGVIKKTLTNTKKNKALDYLLSDVAIIFSCQDIHLKSATRKKKYAMPRNAFIYIADKLKYPHYQIAKAVNRNQDWVRQAMKSCENDMIYNHSYKANIEIILKRESPQT